MSDFSMKLKAFLSRSGRFIVSTARRIVRCVKFKTSEMRHMSIRRDMIKELGNQVYRLNQHGVNLPEELVESLRKIDALEQDLDVLRANYNAQKLEDAKQRAAEKATRAAQKSAAKAAASSEKKAKTAGKQREAEPSISKEPITELPAEQSSTDESLPDDEIQTLEH